MPGDLKMDREPKLFESKCVDEFSRVVDSELGELSSVLVWHDGTGGGMFGRGLHSSTSQLNLSRF